MGTTVNQIKCHFRTVRSYLMMRLFLTKKIVKQHLKSTLPTLKQIVKTCYMALINPASIYN